jgi:hypothetical protein
MSYGVIHDDAIFYDFMTFWTGFIFDITFLNGSRILGHWILSIAGVH